MCLYIIGTLPAESFYISYKVIKLDYKIFLCKAEFDVKPCH